MMNERQMKMMMKRMGMHTKEIEAEEVLIKGKTKDYIISNPNVTLVDVQGQQVIQVIGAIKEVEKTESKPSQGIAINEDDVKIVMDQTKVSRDEAVQALKEAKGSPAEAIINLIKKHGSVP